MTFRYCFSIRINFGFKMDYNKVSHCQDIPCGDLVYICSRNIDNVLQISLMSTSPILSINMTYLAIGLAHTRLHTDTACAIYNSTAVGKSVSSDTSRSLVNRSVVQIHKSYIHVSKLYIHIFIPIFLTVWYSHVPYRWLDVLQMVPLFNMDNQNNGHLLHSIQ